MMEAWRFYNMWAWNLEMKREKRTWWCVLVLDFVCKNKSVIFKNLLLGIQGRRSTQLSGLATYAEVTQVYARS